MSAPAVAEVETEYEQDIRFIGISGQDDLVEMEAFVTDYGITGFEHVADVYGQVWAAFSVTSQPTYIFINDDGTVWRHAGGLQPDELRAELDLLAAS